MPVGETRFLFGRLPISVWSRSLFPGLFDRPLFFPVSLFCLFHWHIFILFGRQFGVELCIFLVRVIVCLCALG